MILPKPSEQNCGASKVTSQERKEARYQRRKAARAAAKAAKCRLADNYDYIFHYHALYRAYRLSRRNVSWKGSVQRYIYGAPVHVFRAWELLREGRYQPPRFYEFELFERGKRRLIKSTTIDDRTVQRALCDGALVPMLGRTFIYDNGACLKGKGYTFAVKRMICHLNRHIRRHGVNGFILIGDIKNYFNSIKHWVCRKILRKEISDLRIIGITEKMIHMFDPSAPPGEAVGLGLGSQISQILAPAVLSAIDHFVKEVLRIPGYARYNDDFYLIHEDREYLEACMDAIDDKLEAIGITLNRKKTQIKRLTKGFKFLKIRVRVTETGKIVRKMCRESIARERRKLKKLCKKVIAGDLTLKQLYDSWQSWNSHAKHFDAYRTRLWMQARYYHFILEVRNHEMVQAA